MSWRARPTLDWAGPGRTGDSERSPTRPSTVGSRVCDSITAPGTRDEGVGERRAAIECPLQLVVSERGHRVDSPPTDHHFVGQRGRIGTTVATLLCDPLEGGGR